MKLLVSTNQTQGQRSNDFCFVPEGELVEPSYFTCDGEQADDPCGCTRSMSGLVSHKATTTMKVVELDITLDTLQQQLTASFRRGGWSQVPGLSPKSALALVRLVEPFPVGSIVEYRDGQISLRTPRL